MRSWACLGSSLPPHLLHTPPRELTDLSDPEILDVLDIFDCRFSGHVGWPQVHLLLGCLIGRATGPSLRCPFSALDLYLLTASLLRSCHFRLIQFVSGQNRR